MKACRVFLPATVLPAMIALAGCGAGGNTGCTPTSFGLSAQADEGTTAPDHTAKAPGNQQKFTAYSGAPEGPGCATPQIVFPVQATWTTSQPTALQISSAKDDTNGLVTCNAATDGAATLTATYNQGSITEHASTSVTCK